MSVVLSVYVCCVFGGCVFEVSAGVCVEWVCCVCGVGMCGVCRVCLCV